MKVGRGRRGPRHRNREESIFLTGLAFFFWGKCILRAEKHVASSGGGVWVFLCG